jgi:hypothetical protein
LTEVVGKYELVFKKCNGRFGEDVKDLVVRNEDGHITIWTGNFGIGPGTSANSNDKCTVETNKIVVQTCYKSTSCLPRNWYYTFTKDAAEYKAGGCYFQFRKTN